LRNAGNDIQGSGDAILSAVQGAGNLLHFVQRDSQFRYELATAMGQSTRGFSFGYCDSLNNIQTEVSHAVESVGESIKPILWFADTATER
jgi:hypothetical protein